jgi:hypothetical protein
MIRLKLHEISDDSIEKSATNATASARFRHLGQPAHDAVPAAPWRPGSR